MIAAGSDNGILQLFDKQGASIVSPWKGHSDTIFSVQFSPDGKYIASCL